MKGTIHEPFHHSFNIKSLMRNTKARFYTGFVLEV